MVGNSQPHPDRHVQALTFRRRLSRYGEVSVSFWKCSEDISSCKNQLPDHVPLHPHLILTPLTFFPSVATLQSEICVIFLSVSDVIRSCPGSGEWPETSSTVNGKTIDKPVIGYIPIFFIYSKGAPPQKKEKEGRIKARSFVGRTKEP